MYERWRRTLVVVLALGVVMSVVGLSGCAKSTSTPTTSSAETPVPGGTFIFGDMTEPSYIDPYNAQQTSDVNVVAQVFDSLVTNDPIDPTKLVPAAAESWEPNADASVWTFKLNPNAKFHDGTPVKASDFVYAWNRLANPKTINTITKKADPSVVSFHLAPVKGYDDVQAGKATEMSGVKAIDDTTLEVTLSYPYADFEYVVAHPALAPVEKALVEGGVDFNGTKVPFGEFPVGNGPFKLSEPWKHDQFINTVKFADYYGDKPLLDGVNFLIFKDTNTEYLEFEAGNLDFSIIGDGQIKAAEAKYGTAPDGYTPEPGKQCVLGNQLSVYYLHILNTDPVFKNVDMRRAVSLAINRQAICEVAWEGTRVPADGFLPPGVTGYKAGAWPEAKYDVEAAKAALAKAGFPGGKGLPTIKLSYNADGPHKPTMELIQSDLATIGINAQLNPYPDFASYLKAMDNDKVQIGRLGWVADYPIADNFIYSNFYSKSANDYSRYKNDAVDKAMIAARQITDTTARATAWGDINAQLGADMPVAPVMFYRNNYVGSDRIHSFVMGPMQIPYFDKAWLTNGGQ